MLIRLLLKSLCALFAACQTNSTGKTSLADCFCDNEKGYIEVPDRDGSRTCVCDIGYTQSQTAELVCIRA